MRIKNIILASGLASFALTSVSNAADNPWYASVTVNQTDVSSVNTQSTEQVAGVTRLIGIDTDDDTAFGLTFGYTVFSQSNGNTLSLELNYSNGEFDLEELRFMDNVFLDSSGTASGELEVESILARVKYQFDLGDFKPYLGLGIGQTDLSVEAIYGGSIGSEIGTQPPFAQGSDSATALEFRAGIEYEIYDSFGVFLEYASTDVDDVEFARTGGGPGGLATTTQSGDFDFDSINVGLNFRF